ncbi:MAG: hypothetical protein ABI270_05350 [Nitrosospira sp.]
MRAPRHAFIAGPDGSGITMLKLSGKSPLDDAIAVNNHGQAIARGLFMNAIPEPSSYAPIFSHCRKKIAVTP